MFITIFCFYLCVENCLQQKRSERKCAHKFFFLFLGSQDAEGCIFGFFLIKYASKIFKNLITLIIILLFLRQKYVFFYGIYFYGHTFQYFSYLHKFF